MSQALARLNQHVADADFLQVFNRLCIALREQQDDSGMTQLVYFDALKDLPVDAVKASALALSQETGRRFFPTTAEWRTAAEVAHRELLRHAVKPAPRGPWQTDCTACEDTGWTLHECDGSRLCGREQPHYAHRYASICPCRPTNRTYQRHQHFGSGE